MNYSINNIEGIGPEFAGRLNRAGINTVDQLLAKGTTAQNRHRIAAESGCNESTILKWVGMADLFRIKGVSSQYSELLHLCGVHSVADLAGRVPKKLHRKMQHINQTKNVSKTIPSLKSLEAFILEAKQLPRINFV